MGIHDEIKQLIAQLEKITHRTVDQQRALDFGREFRDRKYHCNYSNQDTDVRQMLLSQLR